MEEKTGSGTGKRHRKGDGTRLITKLSHKEVWELMNWVSAKREFFANQKLTRDQVLEMATAEFKGRFAPTMNNLRQAFSDMGVEWPRRKVSNNWSALRKLLAAGEERCAALEGLLTEMNARLERAEKVLGEVHTTVCKHSRELDDMLGCDRRHTEEIAALTARLDKARDMAADHDQKIRQQAGLINSFRR